MPHSPERTLDTGIYAGVYTMRGRAYRQYELLLIFLDMVTDQILPVTKCCEHMSYTINTKL